MINPQMSARIIKKAEKLGSKSESLRGAVKFLNKIRKNRFKPTIGSGWSGLLNKPKNVDDLKTSYLMNEWLDHGKVGSLAPKNIVSKCDYKFNSLSNFKLSSDSYAIAKRNNPRKRNITGGSPMCFGQIFQERFEPIYYKGRFKGYTGSELFADYQSCVAISPSGKTAVVVAGCQIAKRIKAPSGMLWKKDDLGIKLERKDGIDYHLEKYDYFDHYFATKIRAKMSEKWKKITTAKRTQKELDRQKLIRDREILTTRVTLDDSRAVGNCVEGSLVYAEKYLKIKREDILNGGYLFSVPASKILKTASNSLAVKAVNRAWMRETTVSI